MRRFFLALTGNIFVDCKDGVLKCLQMLSRELRGMGQAVYKLSKAVGILVN